MQSYWCVANNRISLAPFFLVSNFIGIYRPSPKPLNDKYISWPMTIDWRQGDQFYYQPRCRNCFPIPLSFSALTLEWRRRLHCPSQSILILPSIWLPTVFLAYYTYTLLCLLRCGYIVKIWWVWFIHPYSSVLLHERRGNRNISIDRCVFATKATKRRRREYFRTCAVLSAKG